MPKHLGILGVSAEGAALCYRTVCVEGAELFGRRGRPEVTLHTYSLADDMRQIDRDDWHAVGDMVLASVAHLERSGAELVICPDNTVHQAIDLVRDRSPLPWLHIAEEVAAVAVERRFRRVLVLGTRYLMESPVYPSKLGSRGIQHEIPDREDRERINALTLDELVYGRFTQPTRSYFSEVIAEAGQPGSAPSALPCPDFPFLTAQAH